MPRGVPKKQQPRIFVATMSFDSEAGPAIAGVTRVREGHKLLKLYPDWFEPLDASPAYQDVEAATAAPGETRDVALSAAAGDDE
jgi:hypothetical protein